MSFCYECRAEWALDHSCEEAEKEWTASSADEVKLCPECSVPIFRKAGCNSMTCTVCKTKFCWLCLERDPKGDHFLSVTGCTYFGKKPWSRKKRKLYQAGILAAAPLTPLFVGVTASVLSVGIPIVIGKRIKKIMTQKTQNKHKRRCVVVAGVTTAALISPIWATTSVSVFVAKLYAKTFYNFCTD